MNQWQRIWEAKRKRLAQLKSRSDSYMAELWQGLAEGRSVRDIHKGIRKITEWYDRRGFASEPKAERLMMKAAKVGRKAIMAQLPYKKDEIRERGRGAVISALALRFITDKKIYERANTINFDNAKKEEGESKMWLMESMRKEAYQEAKGKPWDQARVFWLASKHLDCAEDHIPYQGKLYYDRYWRRCITDPQGRADMETFIEANALRSYQWVINRPAWLVTRPNCRHFFKQITYQEAQENLESLLQRMNMVKEKGNTDNQTIKHPLNKGWYTEENVRDIIQKYERRLETHERMMARHPTEELRRMIEKDRLMIKKWTAYLRRMKKA